MNKNTIKIINYGLRSMIMIMLLVFFGLTRDHSYMAALFVVMVLHFFKEN